MFIIREKYVYEYTSIPSWKHIHPQLKLWKARKRKNDKNILLQRYKIQAVTYVYS